MSERERTRGKALTTQDLELWLAVTADVRAYRGRPIPPKPPPVASAPHAAETLSRRPIPPAPRAAPAPVDIDHRTRKDLRKGRLAVDAKLDLHGMRQAEAQQALSGFLRRAQADGAKIAIIVTGKGQSGEGAGVLRRLAPIWLRSPNLRDIVSSFGEAARQHGGEGALYVRIRRGKSRGA